MSGYKYYILKIKLLSPISTPLQADTIWGHICWGIKYHEGEKSLNSFIREYESETPPLIISDGFYENSLPCPKLTPYISESLTIEQMKKLKSKKSIKFIPRNLLLSQKLSVLNLEPIPIKSAEIVRLRNTIDRILGSTATDGGLFEELETWYEKGTIFDIYVLTNLRKDEALKLFKYGFSIGYGKDATTGKGVIEISSINDVSDIPLSGNRIMALASFVPSEKDSIENLYADIFTKYGKLGGDYAVNKNPFKKPIIMFKTGATFNLKEKKFWVGSLLSDVHKDPQIRHYAFAPLIYFNEEVKNA